MKKLLTMSLVLCMVLSMAGCGGSETSTSGTSSSTSASTSSSSSSEEPIKIGVLTPLTGNASQIGYGCLASVEMFLESVDYEIAGRKIELSYADSPESAAICIEMTERMVLRDGVDIIIGPINGAEGVAIKEYAPNIPEATIIVAGSAAEDVTMRGVEPNVFRTSYTGSQVTFALGTFAYEELGYRNVATIAENYDFPFAQIAGFTLSFVRAGGEVSEKLWVEMGTSDYSSVIAKIPNDIDAMYCVLSSNDALNFLAQLESFGRHGDFAILGGTTFVDTFTLSSDVGYLLDGVYASSHWAQALDFPESLDYNQQFFDYYGEEPTLWSTDYYIAMQICAAAIEAVDGNIEDLEAFWDAIEATDIDTARGPVTMDEYHNVVENVYITQVSQAEDGSYFTAPCLVYENQDQFGPFDADWYQSLPSPDQDHPTVEECQTAILKS